ncbi:helix-turn-helix domain-containing protein [Mycobacteroides chelonae]|uniref:helix-turn-helix domain-containing protein n=1 Tax=Mycobacteroides chelonae TaxID=1774 RepID=UPI0009919271
MDCVVCSTVFNARISCRFESWPPGCVCGLRYFVAVADALSFAQAFEALCVALPSLSGRIGDMKSALQHRLSIRAIPAALNCPGTLLV